MPCISKNFLKIPRSLFTKLLRNAIKILRTFHTNFTNFVFYFSNTFNIILFSFPAVYSYDYAFYDPYFDPFYDPYIYEPVLGKSFSNISNVSLSHFLFLSIFSYFISYFHNFHVIIKKKKKTHLIS